MQKGSIPSLLVCDSVLFLKTYVETLGSKKSTQLLLLFFFKGLGSAKAQLSERFLQVYPGIDFNLLL